MERRLSVVACVCVVAVGWLASRGAAARDARAVDRDPEGYVYREHSVQVCFLSLCLSLSLSVYGARGRGERERGCSVLGLLGSSPPGDDGSRLAHSLSLSAISLSL
jgi:hypothetical protein